MEEKRGEKRENGLRGGENRALLEVFSKLEMELISVAISFAFITLLIYAWRLLNWVWLRPKKLERCLRQQGITGNSYRLLHGDVREMLRMISEANSRPISLSDEIVQRVLPFHYHSLKKYGIAGFLIFFFFPNCLS
ncbi:Cytochrome P450 CYP72A219 [Vitis vinifera]|uniref:Cytochrome P450 CYP72A219 n=1 Tax=Vitis vinifera TaxID=29760 RepID=A0A438H184_VITVI|nr:Cytochrome P450 CYP72A219 [Vitis vinifera]